MELNANDVAASLRKIDQGILLAEQGAAELEAMEKQIDGLKGADKAPKALDNLIRRLCSLKRAKKTLHQRLVRLASANGIALPRIGT